MSLGLLAGIVGMSGYIPYIRDILRGNTKPQRVAWLIWLLEYSALFVAQLRSGAGASLWLIGLQLVGVIVICALSYRYGTGAFNRRDVTVLVCVCIALLAWYFTGSASLAIWLLITIEMAGVSLTAHKVYNQPGTETLSTWTLFAIAGMLGVAAEGLGATITLYAYPAALIVMGLSIVMASWLGARAMQRATLTLEPNTPPAP